jgi:hypothetical protein
MGNNNERNGGLASARAKLGGIAAAYVAHSWLTNDSRGGNDLTADAQSLLRELGWDGEDFEGFAEEIERRCCEEPLSVQIRGGWYDPGAEAEPEEYSILMTTGGPAVRITGKLGRYGEPADAEIAGQDWFTPWESIETSSEDDEALRWFASLFYYGE